MEREDFTRLKMVKKKKEEQIKAAELLKEEEKLLREESAALKGTKNIKISDTKADSSMLSGFDTAEDTDIVFK